ncbi:MAG: hypothetical protein A370_04729 [Clostridium sp. Maddingley MBC34-26]|nr:MAG: hypothetical protein A370_04729 [Clostridium sp. Maddingley MBC34-26]
MLQDDNIYMMHNKIINPQEVVSIPVPLYLSSIFNYFVCRIFSGSNEIIT